jgi:hypothetical protein
MIKNGFKFCFENYNLVRVVIAYFAVFIHIHGIDDFKSQIFQYTKLVNILCSQNSIFFIKFGS